MTLIEHLREARTRLFRMLLALLVAAAAGYLLSDQILEILRTPIEALAATRNASLNYYSISAAFDLKLRIALFAGLALSSPVWLYQVFAFLMPGLTRREKACTLGFVVAAVPLFVIGCVTGFLLFPHVVELLAGIASTDDSTMLVASYYVDFVMKLVLAVGVAFVLPVFVVLLNVVGVLPAQSVVSSWRVVILGILVFSAIATPSADIATMFLLAVPMTALFAAAAVIAMMHDRVAAKRRARLTADEAAPDRVVDRELVDA